MLPNSKVGIVELACDLVQSLHNPDYKLNFENPEMCIFTLAVGRPKLAVVMPSMPGFAPKRQSFCTLEVDD
jgi:hypothetical protein